YIKNSKMRDFRSKWQNKIENKLFERKVVQRVFFDRRNEYGLCYNNRIA
ncbi:D-beta-hydroxybutyrate permease, partial [Listeria monocytogenes]|nr:D-beta-hydroxybutyrate permease [Listeria monocytogenes]EAE9182424.1 D-beta-hydroxybutyrate permease [Listeria monocytogenes]